MKKINLLGLLLGVAIAPAALANGTLTLINQTPGASFGDGGELTVSSSPALSGYSRSAGTIQTFCIESGVKISVGGTYNYSLTMADHTGNSLKAGTAWLFSQFSTGTWSQYDYAQDPGNVTDAGNLQAAIWYFQGQTPDQAGFNASASNPYVIDAIGALGAGATSAATLADGVNVVSLFTASGAPAQDVLSLVTVPDGGTTVALLGFVLVGLEGLRRRFAC